MTIYDQDYIAELSAQEAATKTGVQDSAAENQEANASQDVEEHIADASQMVEAVSEDGSADASNPLEIPSDKEMNFKALREELATIKQEKERLARDFEDIRRAQNVQRQPEPPRKRAIDDINNDDLVTGAQFKQIMSEREAEFEKRFADQETEHLQNSMRAKYSDYDEVLAKYGVPLIEQEPDFARGFLGAQNKASYLYKIGKQVQESTEYRRMLQEQNGPSSSTAFTKGAKDNRKLAKARNFI